MPNDNQWTERGDYVLEDRKLLIGSHYFLFTDEFNDLAYEKLDLNVPEMLQDEIRSEQNLIALLEEYGVDRASAPVKDYYGNPTTQKIKIVSVPAGYNWSVSTDDGHDYDYSITFPWKEFTVAFFNNDKSNHFVKAHKEGRLVGIKEGNPRILPPDDDDVVDLTGDD